MMPSLCSSSSSSQVGAGRQSQTQQSCQGATTMGGWAGWVITLRSCSNAGHRPPNRGPPSRTSNNQALLRGILLAYPTLPIPAWTHVSSRLDSKRHGHASLVQGHSSAGFSTSAEDTKFTKRGRQSRTKRTVEAALRGCSWMAPLFLTSFCSIKFEIARRPSHTGLCCCNQEHACGNPRSLSQHPFQHMKSTPVGIIKEAAKLLKRLALGLLGGRCEAPQGILGIKPPGRPGSVDPGCPPGRVRQRHAMQAADRARKMGEKLRRGRKSCRLPYPEPPN